MQTQPSYQHHLGLKKLHTCEAGARQKSVKGKCQNEVWFVCARVGVFVCGWAARCWHKNKVTLQLVPVFTAQQAARTHPPYWIFPSACSLEPYRAHEKAPCWTRFLCGSISRLLFCPSWAYNAFSPQTREKCKTSVDYIKIWHFQACTLSNLSYSSHFNPPLHTMYMFFCFPSVTFLNI